jgi:valyl-tRNA synthetase
LLPAIVSGGERTDLLREQLTTLASLAGLDLEKLVICETLTEKPSGHVALVVGAVEIYLPLSGLVNVDEERIRLQKTLAEVDGQITRLEKLLASPFAEKAPAEVVQKEKEKLAGYRETANKLTAQLQGLE